MTDDRTPGEESEPLSLEAWGPTGSAPPGLRRATLNAARERGLVKGGFMSGRGFLLGVAAAAAAMTFVVGFGLGERQAVRAGGDAMTHTSTTPSTAVTPAAAAGHKYMLFLFEDASYRAPAAGEMADRVREYGAWARGLAESGRFVDGEKLADDGRFCRLENGALAAAGPQADAKRGGLTGYFVIGAANLDEAMGVAKGCPHLKYGGTLEIRQIET